MKYKISRFIVILKIKNDYNDCLLLEIEMSLIL